MKYFRRGPFRWALITLVLVLLAVPLVASAAELVTAELTGTVNDVTVTQGSSASFTISLSATGKIASINTSGNPSTATVNTSYSLAASGALSSSSPSSVLNFFAGSTGCAGPNCDVTWTGAPTPYAVSATLSANASTPVGNYPITLSDAANTTEVSNPNATGAKLADDTATTIIVHVVAPPPPADSTPPVITPNVSGTLGDNGWYISDVTVSWSVVDN